MNYMLYVITGCPHCQKVIDFAEENKIPLELKNIGEEGNEKELMEKGGKKRVPFLVDGEKMMHESDDIIEYLKSKM